MAYISNKQPTTAPAIPVALMPIFLLVAPIMPVITAIGSSIIPNIKIPNIAEYDERLDKTELSWEYRNKNKAYRIRLRKVSD